MKHREREFLALMKDADRRYYAEIAARRARPEQFKPSRKGRAAEMKSEKTHHVRKIIIGLGVAAAVLGGGTMAAMVAMRGSHGGTHYEYSEIDSILQSKSESSEAKDNTPALHLTEQYWYPAMQSPKTVSDEYYTQSDTGWYHSTYMRLQASDGDSNSDAFGRAVRNYNETHPNQITRSTRPVMYYDSELHEDVVLCAKPDCLHDENEYCEATTAAYYHGSLTWHEGMLYAAAQKQTNTRDGVLLSYDPAGTGITELANFEIEQATPIDGVVVHRGYVWCIFRLNNPVEGMGYVIEGYEIATGQTVELYRSVPPADQAEQYELPTQFTACGDYLFYRVQYGHWPSENYKGIFSINLKTGEHKKVVSVGDTRFEAAYTAAEDSVIWCYGDGVTAPRKYVRTNLETGEQTDFCGAWFSMLTYDGTYFYGVQEIVEGNTAHNEIAVMDKNGKELGRYRMENGRGITGIMAADGMLYLAKYGKMTAIQSDYAETDTLEINADLPWDGVLIACKTDDLIAGDPQFTELFKITNRITVDVEPFK